MYRGVSVAMFEDIGRVNPYLVGGFNHLEKIVNGKDYPIYYVK
jgi:hypothetical protein